MNAKSFRELKVWQKTHITTLHLLITTYYLLLTTLLLATPLTAYDKLDLFFKEIKVVKVNETSATIEWETSIPSQGMIKYGLNANELFCISYDVATKERHKLNIRNLQKGTHYYFIIIASSSNDRIFSPINSFKTEGIPPLAIIINKVFDITEDSVKIGWAFTQPVKVRLKYVEVTKTDFVEHIADKIDKSGAFILKGLKSDTSYYYVIEGQNEKGKIVKSKIAHFKTDEWNVALGMPVEGTFKNYITSDPYFDKKGDMLKRVTDGKLNYIDGMAVSGNVQNDDQNLIIELKRDYSIEKIVVYWRALSYSRDYAIFVSKDKKNWELIKANIDAGKGKRIRGEKGDPIVYNEIDCNKKARYVKLFIKKGSKVYNKHTGWNFVQIMEIKVVSAK